MLNKLLFQRKIQRKKIQDMKKAIAMKKFENQKNKYEEEMKEKEQNMDQVEKKKLNFYDEIFKADGQVKNEDKIEEGQPKRSKRNKPKIENKKEENRDKNNLKKNISKKLTEQEKEKFVKHKRNKAKKMMKKTKKGQPIMAHRVNDLLEKIKKRI